MRRKSGMVALIPEIYITALKVAYVAPIFIYVYVLFNLKELVVLDYVGLFFNFIGAFIVVKAKKDLGKFHTWTGFRYEKIALFTHGIYAYMRHPLYAGIFVFMFGVFLVIFFRLSIWALLLVLVVLFYASLIIAIAAKKESKILMKEHGEEFVGYMKNVHSFLPVKRFRKL